MSICIKCGIEKDEKEFPKNYKMKNGRLTCCKECCGKYQKEYRKEHREELKKYGKKHYKEHQEELKKYGKKHYKEHQEELKKHYKEHREERKEYQKEYQEKIKSRYGISVHSIVNYGLKNALFAYDRAERKCENCGEENDLTIHHKDGNGLNNIRNGKKANNDVDNLIVLCRKCHGSIHGKQNKGKHLSEETKRKISEARLGKHQQKK